MSRFTDMLLERQKELNLMNKDVAKMFDWTPMYYGRYTKGQLKPTEANVEKFAEFLNIETSVLKKILEEDN